MNKVICFIGAGNMAKSLIGGLIASGYHKKNIIAADPSTEQCAALTQTLGIKCFQANQHAVELADIIVLAVKPQLLQSVCHEIQPYVQSSTQLIISVAAGVRLQHINTWLGGKLSIVRAMPNTPSLVQTGATALFSNEHTSNEQKNQAEHILRAAGLTVWVEQESLLDVVTALSGSGPAYYFLFMEAMEQAAIKMGLPPKTAHLLTMQTALGSAKMVMESNQSCQALREHVTSPNGTTEQAIKHFEQANFHHIVEGAMAAAHKRAIEIGNELGGES